MRKVCRSLSISILAALLAAGTLTFADADARSISYDLNIPSEDLTAALQSFAIASHHKLLYKANLTTGKISQALKGHFTAQEAMEALLSGTGLSYEITSSAVVLIKDQNRGKTSDLREEGNILASPRAAPQISDGQPILLAQIDQDKPTSNVPEDKPDQKSKQNKTEGLEEIVVTGSNIRGNTNSASPVILIDRDKIDRSGATTVEGVMNSLPQNFGGGASPQGTFGGIANDDANLNSSFASAAALRGFGAGATLTLIDGHRMAPTGSGAFVDLSLIPLSAVDRIDVLTDGASATYGSDAVAGVVNIVLRHDFDGAETALEGGDATEGGLHHYQASQLLGRNWTSGNALAAVNYYDSSTLTGSSRAYANGLYGVEIPGSQRLSAYGKIRQELADNVDVSTDLLYARRDSQGPYGFGTNWIFEGDQKTITANASLGWQMSKDWRLDVSGGYSKADGNQTLTVYSGLNDHYIYRFWNGEAIANGTVFDLPGGATKVAVGASYRSENYGNINMVFPPESGYGDSRSIKAVFLESVLPIIGEKNAIPGVRKLDLTLAVRHENYSDFGSTTNPKYGLVWEPIGGLKVRGTYGTSFRAPLLDALGAGIGEYITQASDPSSPTGSSNLLEIYGTPRTVGPERAKTATAGFDFSPSAVAGLHSSLTYFNIKYYARIERPASSYATYLGNPAAYGDFLVRNPTPAQINSALNLVTPPGTFQDFVGMGTSAVQVISDGRFLNLTSSKMDGLDFMVDYDFSAFGGNANVGLNTEFIAHYSQIVLPTLPQMALVNTAYNPIGLVGRATAGWLYGGLTLSGAVNYKNGYTDNLVIPSVQIGKYATADARIAYNTRNQPAWSMLQSLELSLSITNLFDQHAPLVEGAPSLYDPANASIIGRYVTAGFRKRW